MNSNLPIPFETEPKKGPSLLLFLPGESNRILESLLDPLMPGYLIGNKG